MMNLLNDNLAAHLQLVTFPLEVLGLSLALIEVRFPSTAARLTRYIETLATPVREARDGQSGALERSLGTLLGRLIHAGIYAYTLLFLLWLATQLPFALTLTTLGHFVVLYLIVLLVVLLLLLVTGIILYFIVAASSEFSRSFVAGRAIGTLGIMIAGVGLLGELYQLLCQLT